MNLNDENRPALSEVEAEYAAALSGDVVLLEIPTPAQITAALMVMCDTERGRRALMLFCEMANLSGRSLDSAQWDALSTLCRASRAGKIDDVVAGVWNG